MKNEVLINLFLFITIYQLNKILSNPKKKDKKYIPCSIIKPIPNITLKIGNYKANVEVIDKLGSGSVGLMNRNFLPKNSGMLFIFDVPIKAYFWNKDTPLALDIAFLNCSGTILEIFQLNPNDETTIESTSDKVFYALELNKGWFAKNNIVPGMKISQI